MAVSIGQLVEQLAASGLITAAQIKSFQASLPSEKSPQDAQALARELILAGKLTKYQAQCVYQRKTKGLVLGEYGGPHRLGVRPALCTFVYIYVVPARAKVQSAGLTPLYSDPATAWQTRATSPQP